MTALFEISEPVLVRFASYLVSRKGDRYEMELVEAASGGGNVGGEVGFVGG
jgi:hypothetical protein